MAAITTMELEFVKQKMENKEFAKALDSCTTAEEYKAVFQENGINISLEDVEKALQTVNDPDFEKNLQVVDDLDEKDLECVSGGSLFLAISATYIVASFMIGYNWKDYKRIYQKIAGKK